MSCSGIAAHGSSVVGKLTNEFILPWHAGRLIRLCLKKHHAARAKRNHVRSRTSAIHFSKTNWSAFSIRTNAIPISDGFA
jgi:hypothetical protein